MRKLCLALAFLLILAGVVALVRRTGGPPRKVAVLFQGFTNNSQGVRLASFCISNCSRTTMIRWGHYGVETRQTPWQKAPQSILGYKASLLPGQAESVSLPVPTNSGAWQAVLFFSKDGWRYRSAMNTNSILMRVTAQNGLSIPTELWKSEWFDQ